jgi:hypothetical protein
MRSRETRPVYPSYSEIMDRMSIHVNVLNIVNKIVRALITLKSPKVEGSALRSVCKVVVAVPLVMVACRYSRWLVDQTLALPKYGLHQRRYLLKRRRPLSSVLLVV